MPNKMITITNPTGLHARPATQLVNLAKQFQSDIQLIKNDKPYNAKSMMKLLQAGIAQNDSITVETEGDDADAALTAIVAFIEATKD